MTEIVPVPLVTLAFEYELVTLPLASLLPVKSVGPTVKASQKYLQIAASVREVGLVEAPVVARDKMSGGLYLLLDGHLRVEALKDLGETEVECLVSTDDEAFTYNRRVNRLSAVQERAMIVRAMERGVSAEKIAAALCIHPVSVQRRVRMLDGICEEVVALLRDKQCPISAFEILRKMKPLRQIESAELMIGMNNYSIKYATLLLATTPQSALVEEGARKKAKGVSPEILARMERELAKLQATVTSIQDSYGRDTLELTVVRGYLTKLLKNNRVVRYLFQTRPEFLDEFQAIAETKLTLPVEVAA
ncbi:ParB N-terminal domain-containing protein [Methylobacterium sp. J-026]|uniref:plasmid partitioning protein RepB C-terminal domain-containing protein n=1 Tax=Methylobacterium sp. J-026 TaxID=2836624 RepID=UPI001FB86A94|nr:plasmid partitioning protein RepB C-terminal domain-containing protein [Methylobacterium sp. J-026]MCJ2132769.1 ParB N-terminal domain-containing protein [Methylobacterium sp. J-026]